MHDYQPVRESKYMLPSAVYHQCLWIIRDYDRLRQELEAVIDSSPGPPDGMPRGSGIGDPVASKAIRREEFRRKTDAVERAFRCIPAEYRRGIWRSIVYHDPYPEDADRATYSRWKSRVVYEVADILGIL